MSPVPAVGETQTYERTFTPDEVRTFAELSGDDQPRHTEPDEEGRLVVQGLLTATLPTKIGSDSGVLAHSVSFSFTRPVYTGQEIHCTTEYEAVTELDDRYAFTAAITCTVDGDVVVEGTVEGFIPVDPDSR